MLAAHPNAVNQRVETEFLGQECFSSEREGGGRGAVLLAGLAFRDFEWDFLLEACDLYF